MATTCNIAIDNDADFRHVFIYQTKDGVPIDISGTTLFMMLRTHVEDVTVPFELTTENGRIVIIDAAAGKFELILLQADLERLAAAEYQQSLIASKGGMLWRIWRGTFTLALGPSR